MSSKPTYTVLWETNEPFRNQYSIVLNDSIDNYDEVICYGSANRGGNDRVNVKTTYPVISGTVNLVGPYTLNTWQSTNYYMLNNGTQMYLSGTSGYVDVSYYWGMQNGGTGFEANRYTTARIADVHPYKIVGVKHDQTDKLWESSGNAYDTNIALNEPITHFNKLMIYSSGTENAADGVHLAKNVYTTQPTVVNGCDAWGYSPWSLGYKCNYILGCSLKLSGNSGHVGSSYFWGIGKDNATWAAGKWTGTAAPIMLQPYQIFGVDRKPVRKLTLLPTTGGTQSASDTSGYEYDQITMSNTPDEGWYFSGYNVTGATVNGNIITLQDQDASAQAGFTDAGFPITYQNDGHGTLTGDTNIGIPGQPVNLTTAYDTYYRFSGYEVTGGYIQDGKLYASAACTAKAVYKLNTFTASGGFEKGSDVSVSERESYWTYKDVPAMYAITSYHTSNVPTAWYNTSKRWKVTSTVSAYKITLNTKLNCFISAGASTVASAAATACSLLGSTATQTQSWMVKYKGSQNTLYSKSFTAANTGINYGLSARLGARGSSRNFYAKAYYYTSGTTGTWVATGIIP